MNNKLINELTKISQNENLSELQLTINEILLLNYQNWWNKDNDKHLLIHQLIKKIHNDLLDGIIWKVGNISFEHKLNNYPNYRILVSPHMMIDIINDGEYLNFILYPMKNNSSISYPTIGYYEYPLINGKLSSDKINEIIYEMGVVFEQEECWDYDIQKMEFRRLFELN